MKPGVSTWWIGEIGHEQQGTQQPGDLGGQKQDPDPHAGDEGRQAKAAKHHVALKGGRHGRGSPHDARERQDRRQRIRGRASTLR